MQIPKIAVLICSFAVATPMAHAADNPDQAAARAALVAKLFEISADSTPTNNAKPAPIMVPASAGAPVFSTTTVVRPAVNVENAVMHPISQPVVTGTVSAPGTESSANFHTIHTPTVSIQNPPINSTTAETTTVYTSTEKPAKKKHKLDKQADMATKPAPAPAAPVVVKSSSEFAPIVAPASPIDASKQQKLQDLLARYKADQITPEEYHRQRAAIINGM